MLPQEREGGKKELDRLQMDRIMRRQYMRHKENEQFHKSMQMLCGNAKSGEKVPYEDYSIFVYRQTAPDFQDRIKELEMKILYPDKEQRLLAEVKKSAMDPHFSGRVKNIEDQLRGIAHEKKPKDLHRAIGKIEKSDWNVKEIEKKISENKFGKGARTQTEKVPKWSKEQYDDKVRKIQMRDADNGGKFSELDDTLKRIEKKMKEGGVLEQGKVSALAAHLTNMNQEPEKPPLQKSNSKAAFVLPAQGGSENCHFCNKRVYLMERLSAEGKFFHRGCFRCDYCNNILRLGSYAYDRDGRFGSRFFCIPHFGLTRLTKRDEQVGNKENIPSQPEPKTPVLLRGEEDMMDQGTTPERIEFENLSGVGETASDQEDSEMDEDEWTDRNFGASAAEASSDEASDLSDSEDEEEFAEALDVNVGMTADETLRLAEKWLRIYNHKKGDDEESGSCHDSDDSREHFSYQEYDSEDEESETATEGEEELRARELRRQEARVEAPDVDTGSDTEVIKPVHSDVDFSDKDFDFELPPDFNVTEFLSEFDSDKHVGRAEWSESPNTERAAWAVPPDVVRDSHIAPSPELISEISTLSSGIPSVDEIRSKSPPVPARRKKSNSFRITTSNINVSKPQIITIRNDNKINQETTTPPVLPLRKSKISKSEKTPENYSDENRVVGKLSKLHISEPADKYYKSETRIHHTLNSPSTTSIYGTPPASPSVLSPVDTSKKISHIVEKVTSPSTDKNIKSVLASKMDKKLSPKDRTDPHHSKECIVM